MAAMPPMEVEVIVARAESITRTAEAPGRMEAVRTAEVRARVEGILEKRRFSEGSEVHAGDTLFQIDPRSLEADVATARAAVARAEAQALVSSQNLQRKKSLIDSNAVSRQEVDQAVAAKAQAEAELESSRASLRRAEILLSYATVTAPISGRIGRARVTEGALVGKGEPTHLATIEQYDPIRVAFSQPSADFLQLRESMRQGKAKASAAPVQLRLEDGKPYPHPGKLLFNDLAVDPATGTVGMRAEFPNPKRDLLPGQFVTVVLPLAQTSAVISVPQRSVLASAQGQSVLVVGADGSVQPRPVQTGGMAGDHWIIQEGLQGGEQVIVTACRRCGRE